MLSLPRLRIPAALALASAAALNGCIIHTHEYRYETPAAQQQPAPATQSAAETSTAATQPAATGRRRTPANPELAAYVRENYSKSEHQIAMRDGKRLFTIVYSPKDASAEKTYPMLMIRTPYSIGPYGPEAYRDSLGPSADYARDGYIFVYQDVRGCYMSEGDFVNMTPHNPEKKSNTDIDESTDAWDSIDWLVKNVPHNNGRVGQYGISYPGFYVRQA